MTAVDLIALGLVVVTALSGLRRGLVTGVLSLAGLAGGAYLGARVGPSLVGEGGDRWLPLVALGGAMTLAAVGQSLGGLLGRRARGGLRIVPPLRALDSVGGGFLGVATGLVACWAVGAVFLYVPGQSELRRYAQDSTILSTLNDRFPPERLMDALARVDPFGQLAGPGAGVPPPDPSFAARPGVLAAAPSVVRVSGFACGLGVEGSGWIAAPGVVVTNAHVVAGVLEPRVDRRDGLYEPASVVAFDRVNDVAVLRVPGLRGAPLPLGEATAGAESALLGFPENGPFTVTPARVGKTVLIVGRDAYGHFPTPRTVTTVRGSVRSGNSGGPVVDAAGRVLATIFAQRAGGDGGYAVPDRYVRDALEQAGTEPLETRCVER